jgi:hypothetical protein
MHPRLLLLNRGPAVRAARTSFLILAAIVGVAWGAAPPRSQLRQPPQETWYVFRMAGQDVGHICETTQRTGDGVKTTVETLIIINRLGSKVEIKGKAVFNETAEGQLESARSEMSSSRQTTTLDAQVEKDAVRLLVSTGGKQYRRKLPFSGTVLGPWGMRQRSVRGLQKEEDSLTCQALVPEMERLARVTRKLLDSNATLSLLGKKSVCARVEERLEGYPAVRTVWLDRQGRMVRHTESGPFGKTEIVLADRATALRAGSGRLLKELYDQTLVRANVRLPGPRSLGRLVLRLRQKEPSLGWPDLSGPGQTILRRDDKEMLIEVRQVKPKGTTPRPVKTKGIDEYLQPNAVVQSDDEEVQRIAREVVGTEADAFRAACRLRDWVRRSMKFDLGIALAPASEVIRQRKGTCAAYAVALASLVRAAGVPSRIVMGYVYISGIWGGHAWVEVRTGSQWVPLDAALPSPGPADAARLACVRTSLADGPNVLLEALARAYGNLQVTTVEYEVEGITTKVPDAGRGFTIEGDLYRNPWLGLEVRKPAGFHFAKTDAVYPDSTVVAVEGTDRQRVCVRQEDALAGGDHKEAGAEALRNLGFTGKPAEEKVAGRSVLVVEGKGKAGLAFAQGLDLWVLTAQGQRAGELVRRVAAGVTIGRRGR